MLAVRRIFVALLFVSLTMSTLPGNLAAMTMPHAMAGMTMDDAGAGCITAGDMESALPASCMRCPPGLVGLLYDAGLVVLVLSREVPHSDRALLQLASRSPEPNPP